MSQGANADFGAGAVNGYADPNYGQPEAQNPYGQPGFELDPGLQHAPVAGSENALDAGYDADDDDYDVEPQRSTSSRMFMIAGALVGAIAVGGGLAYGYKTFFGQSGQQVAGQPPVVKGGGGPTKVRPSNPGGRQFAHTESKMMDRLGGGSGRSVSQSGSTRPATRDANGTRKVSTVVIGRDGAVRQQRPAPTPSNATIASPAVAIPGLSVVGPLSSVGGASSSQARPAAATRASDPLSPARTAKPLVVRPPTNSPPQQQRVAAARPATPPSLPGLSVSNNRPAQSTTRPAIQSVTPGNVQVAPSNGSGVTRVINPVTGRSVVVVAPDRKGNVPAAALNRVAVSNVVSRPSAVGASAVQSVARTTPGRAATAGSPGYVVVLASVPKSGSSRIEALTKFADLQQTYGNVLAGKTPDVREANLGARGSYHRLMIGPPGSRESASGLCSSLKQAGYTGCWVTPY
ncbi:MAG: SPOR domain-containing protein [Planctomycetota bacterium]